LSYRYIGNKARISAFLVDLIAERCPEGGVVADLMCGTGSVSAALRRAGFRVFASDVMTYAYLHARVRLKMARAPQFAGLGGYAETLQYLNTLLPREGIFFQEYSPGGVPSAGCKPRMYFTAENAARIDAVLSELWRLKRRAVLTAPEFDLLRHDCVLASNRVANIAGTYGHYRSKWSDAALAPFSLQETLFEPGSTKHSVRQGLAERIAQDLEADACYLDPPYTKRQYAANYHIPETVARGDKPAAIGVSGLRPWRDQYSNFCSKLRVRDAFSTIISGMNCSRFLISYSEDGLLAMDELEAFLGSFGTVTVVEFSVQRFRSNASSLGPRVTEYVFDLRKRQQRR
jgi:adenine-specific DNA-methyltransferase